MLQRGVVELGDCLEKMKLLPDNSVDLTFTSPPYNDIGSDDENVAVYREGERTTHKKYLTTESHHDDWLEWQIECIDQMLRVSKKYVLYNVQALKKNRENIYKLIGHYADKIHDIIILNKQNGVPTSTKHSISNTYEFIIILKKRKSDKVKVNSDFFRNLINTYNNTNKEFSQIHRAVMNKEWSDIVIREFSDENDLVLDPFGGMGTTAVSCIEQNRYYLLYELCEEYYNKCIERLEAKENEVNKNN